MASSVDTHRAAHKAFNNGDWEAMRSLVGENVSYVDHQRDVRIASVDEFLGWLDEWKAGMSDARVDEPEYLEAGDWSIARFSGRGTNDGPMGPAQATGNRLDFAVCELMRVEDGKVVQGEIYYDQMTMMVQLGVVEAPAPA